MVGHAFSSRVMALGRACSKSLRGPEAHITEMMYNNITFVKLEDRFICVC
jgi:hypothetical protein